MSLSKLKKDRLTKLANLSKIGIDSYPQKSERNFVCGDVLEKFENLMENGEKIILAGRLTALRSHGGSCFADLKDASGQIQIYFKKDILGEKYDLFVDNVDMGDFVEAGGALFTTKAGEKTLRVDNYKILAKAILPLPQEWYGLKDTEERFRKRYLDLLINSEVKKKFEIRAGLIRDIRTFLEKDGFIEVETPILQNMAGGALARPFKTHLNALNLDLYLRIAPELYLKRLLVGGFEKVYEIGRCFRNEGMDFSHNPDFTMLEFYWAYSDYERLMDFTERMFTFLVPNLEIEYGGQKINLISPWPKIDFEDLIEKNCLFKLSEISDGDLLKEIKKLGLKMEKGAPRFKMLDEIYKKTCRPKLIQPTFVIHHPIEMSPLAKALPNNSKKAARFQLVIAGMEIVNAYSELNNPLEQEARFKEQMSHRERGEKEAHEYDKDFIEALEFGMPPAAGFGLGMDRLALLLTDSHSVREVILFPTMKPKK